MFGDSGAKYRSVAHDLQGQIERGELQPGDRLPSIRQLATTRRLSHATATKVMRELCRLGYAYVSGNATYVKDRGQAELTMTRPVWGARRGGRGGYGLPAQLPGWNLYTEAGIIIPPAYVSDVMELEPGTPVLRREIVRRWRPTMAGGERVDDSTPLRPYSLEVHWYPAAWAEISPSLLHTGTDDGTSPLMDNGYGATLAEQATGRTGYVGVEAQHARLADEREARLLEVEVGSVVLACVETWGDDQGVVHYKESVHPMGVVRMIEHRDPDESDEE